MRVSMNLLPWGFSSVCRRMAELSAQRIFESRRPQRRILQRQLHSVEDGSVAWVAMQAVEQLIGFYLSHPSVALLIGAIKPLKDFVRFSAIRVYLGDLISRIVLMISDKFLQSSVGILETPQRVIDQGFARQFRPFDRLLLGLDERLLRAVFWRGGPCR